MKTKKIPQRMCIVTKERFPKQELIRIVRTPNNEVVVDKTGKLNGKGAYLKKDLEVFKKAQKSNILSNALEIQIPNEVYTELENLINN